MIKKEIYPKTKRVSCRGNKVYVTEKLDGSNMVIFKKDDIVYVAQRKTILSLNEIEEHKDVLYKGLYNWIKEYGSYFEEHLLNNSALCGEWLGMGNIKYSVDTFDKRWYMFAKANIDDDFNLYNLIYEHDLFIYPFDNQEFPFFLGIVPDVIELNILPTKEYLDCIYDKYCEKVNRPVEGFVINYKNIISKYVRYKNGKLTEHFDRGE